MLGFIEGQNPLLVYNMPTLGLSSNADTDMNIQSTKQLQIVALCAMPQVMDEIRTSGKR